MFSTSKRYPGLSGTNYLEFAGIEKQSAWFVPLSIVHRQRCTYHCPHQSAGSTCYGRASAAWNFGKISANGWYPTPAPHHLQLAGHYNGSSVSVCQIIRVQLIWYWRVEYDTPTSCISECISSTIARTWLHRYPTVT